MIVPTRIHANRLSICIFENSQRGAHFRTRSPLRTRATRKLSPYQLIGIGPRYGVGSQLIWIIYLLVSQRLPRWITRVHGGLAAFIENENGIGIAMGRLHSGRSNRHARHRQSDRLRPLTQEALNLRGRNMSFYRVAINDRSMARHHASGNAVLPLISRGVVHFLDFDGEAIGFEMFHPFATAPASRRLEDCD